MQNEEIGMRVRKLRREKRLTQEQLAERLDCSVQFLSLVERGQRGMSLRMFCVCAEILCVSADELLGRGTVCGTRENEGKGLQVLEGCGRLERKMVLDVAEVIKRDLREKL